MNKLKIDLGGGHSESYVEGFKIVDKIKHGGVHYEHDLNKYPYPFKDNSVDFIRAFHIIEHLNSVQDCMGECFRILKPGGILHIKVPHYTSNGAYLELHKNQGMWYYCFTSERMFVHSNLESLQLYKNWDELKRRLNFYMVYPWNWIVKPIINFIPFMPQIYETTFLCYLFPAKEVEVVLRKQKDIKITKKVVGQ